VGVHAGQVVTVAVAETTLAIDLGDGDTHVVHHRPGGPQH
jgi:hypothetical protein